MANMNKKALEDIFRIEDAKSLCEAFGAEMPVDDGMDDLEPIDLNSILDVTPNVNPTGEPAFASIGDDTATPEGQEAITQAFVEELNKLPNDTIEVSDIPAMAAVIAGQHGFKGDIASFLEKQIMGAAGMLGAMNKSEENPNGAVNVDDPGLAPEASAAPATPVDGIPPMDEVPGAVEAPAPSLETNPDDMGVGALDDLGLDNIADEPAPDLAGFDAVTDDSLETAGDELDNLDTVEIPVGDETEEKTAETEEKKETEETAEVGDDGLDKIDLAGLDAISDDIEADETPAEEKKETEETTEEPDESIEKLGAKLESIQGSYEDKRIADNIRAVVESFDQARAERKAMRAKQKELDAIVESVKADANETKTDAILESLVGDYAAKLKASRHDAKVNAQLESIVANFGKEKSVNAKLESIVSDFMKQETVSAKLESIADEYLASDEANVQLDEPAPEVAENEEPVVENATEETVPEETVTEEVVKEEVTPTLESQLDAIAERTRAMMA